MKTIRITVLAVGVVLIAISLAAQTVAAPGFAAPAATTSAGSASAQPAGPCGGGCGPKAESPAKPAIVTLEPVPGSNESVPVGQIENLVPISVLSVLGCEKCVEQTVAWALQHGSTYDEVDRVLRMLSEMQKLECFNRQFGPDAASRMDKPLAAARRTLQQATTGAGK